MDQRCRIPSHALNDIPTLNREGMPGFISVDLISVYKCGKRECGHDLGQSLVDQDNEISYLYQCALYWFVPAV